MVATIGAIWMANVREGYLKRELSDARERIAELNNETARLRAKEPLVDDALLANAQAGRANALAAQAILTLAEQIALAQGLVTSGTISEAARSLLIISKVKPFAGKQFDAVVTSSDIGLGTLLRSLRFALKAAGWIEISRSDGGVQSNVGGDALVIIDVDADKDSELLDAAESLASALNAEDIAAKVNPKAAIPNANVIHILIGPKP